MITRPTVYYCMLLAAALLGVTITTQDKSFWEKNSEIIGLLITIAIVTVIISVSLVVVIILGIKLYRIASLTKTTKYLVKSISLSTGVVFALLYYLPLFGNGSEKLIATLCVSIILGITFGWYFWIVSDPVQIYRLESGSHQIRTVIAENLGYSKSNLAVQPLLKTIENDGSDIGLRRAAIKSLGKIQDPNAVEPLIKVLKDSNESLRLEAISALGEIKDERATSVLLELLRDDNLSVKGFTIEALGRIKASAAFEPMIDAVKHTDSYVRQVAVTALGRIGNTQGAEPLAIILKNNAEVKAVRDAAADALEQLNSPTTKQILLDYREYQRFESSIPNRLLLACFTLPLMIVSCGTVNYLGSDSQDVFGVKRLAETELYSYSRPNLRKRAAGDIVQYIFTEHGLLSILTAICISLPLIICLSKLNKKYEGGHFKFWGYSGQGDKPITLISVLEDPAYRLLFIILMVFSFLFWMRS